MRRMVMQLALVCLFLAAGSAQAGLTVDDLVASVDGGALSGVGDYEWWYGCSPTSAGMMMSYYDTIGYDGLCYDNLIAGTAASSTYGVTGTSAQAAIASNGHIADFYSGGYLATGDDVDSGRSFDCLADFMGTSQDSVSNSNGETTFYNYTDGSRLYAGDLASYGASYANRSGMVGLWEYLDYCGYGDGVLDTEMIYNQYIDTLGLNYGFSWEDYLAEIDAGRVVMIHVSGHTMLGYGYDELTGEILLHDTWTQGQQRMAWGGEYDGLAQFSVTVFEPTGGTLCAVPVPGAFVLASIGVAFVTRRRKLRVG